MNIYQSSILGQNTSHWKEINLTDYLNQQLQLPVIEEVNLAQTALCHLWGNTKIKWDAKTPAKKHTQTPPVCLRSKLSLHTLRLRKNAPLFRRSWTVTHLSVVFFFVVDE